MFNAKVAAAAQGVLGPVCLTENDNGVPLQAVLNMGDARDSDLADLYQPMLARETNRRIGIASSMRADTIELLHTVSRREGARLHLLTSRDEIAAAATILAAADRIRYLSPKLHGDMVSGCAGPMISAPTRVSTSAVWSWTPPISRCSRYCGVPT